MGRFSRQANFLDSHVFTIPVVDQFLVYAPLHDLAALVNRAALLDLKRALLTGQRAEDGELGALCSALRADCAPPPTPKSGPLDPAFLGLLSTRQCNLACRYCGFVPSDDLPHTMDLELVRDVIEWYMAGVRESGYSQAEIHFFGGEPFYAPEVLDLAVHLARLRAQAFGSTVRFETATNGVFGEARCRWAADHLDTIVLSLDGPADIHDAHRPYRDGRGSYEIVDRSARILSEGACDLYIRSCVTDETAHRMPEVAAWFCQHYRPQGVCFEPVQPMETPRGSSFRPPNPFAYTRYFFEAAEILERSGIEPVYASADIHAQRVSFCPVGQDAVIVSPDGSLSACYLLEDEWQARGMDLHLGSVDGEGRVELDADALASTRRLNVWNKPACDKCFCRWHCAGGCHVNHPLSDTPGGYDRLCHQTRLIAVRSLLKSMGRQDLIRQLAQDDSALRRAACQTSDRLVEIEELL
jgi:uncharacterized protein